MSVKHCNSSRDFDSAVGSAGSKLVVVDFFATWCGPCRAVAPTVDSLASSHASTCLFIKVDVDQAKDVAQRYNVTSMPTFVFLHKGREVDRFSGGDGSRLTSLVSRLASELGASSGITGAGAGVAGGDDLVPEGGNPWARPGFRPPGMAALGQRDPPAPAAAPSAAHKPAPAAAAAPTTSASAGAGAGAGDFDVVCENGVCRRVPKPADAAAPAPSHPPATSPGSASGMLAAVAALRREQYRSEVSPSAEAESIALHRARLAVNREDDAKAKEAAARASARANAEKNREKAAEEREKMLLRKRLAEDKARRVEEAKRRAEQLEKIRAEKNAK